MNDVYKRLFLERVAAAFTEIRLFWTIALLRPAELWSAACWMIASSLALLTCPVDPSQDSFR
jgi:hypothetical protein